MLLLYHWWEHPEPLADYGLDPEQMHARLTVTRKNAFLIVDRSRKCLICSEMTISCSKRERKWI